MIISAIKCSYFMLGLMSHFHFKMFILVTLFVLFNNSVQRLSLYIGNKKTFKPTVAYDNDHFI